MAGRDDVISLIVMALGVLLSLAGAAAIAVGYPVIEIERGWAAVIAGAVLLSGGVVTAALGVVVRLLTGLRHTARNVAALATQVAPTPQNDVAAPVPEEEATVLTTVPPPPIRRARPSLVDAAPSLAVAAPIGAAASYAATRWHEQQREAAPSAATPDPVADSAAWHDSPEVPDDPPPAASPPPRDGSSPQPVHPEPSQNSETPARAPQNEAWLDQAFQAFDYDMAGHGAVAAHVAPSAHPEMTPEPQNAPVTHEAPEPLVEPEAPVEDSPPPVPHPAGDEALVETDHQPEAHQPEPAPASDLAIIGRYDSEGTSYVMYSDGSIEAQSEAGVYRFSSMAELKAFIEG